MRYAAPLFVSMVLAGCTGAQEAERRLSVDEYRDKMKAGWVGQMAGVAWGAPTEFRFRDQIMPEDAMPQWSPEVINHSFGQDDLYVEMTFLRSMEKYGLDVPIRRAGIDFANSRYALWCANRAGRMNLRRGIAPPDSSHPQFTPCPNDIDYQIEADYSGLIAPGLPNTAIAMGEKFGRLMNYGDGMYAGQFIGGLYAEAFFETDIVTIVQAALRCIPAGSQYAEMVRDMLAWYERNPDDWQKTWQWAQAKYRENPEYQKGSNGGIDCRINGAYVLMGLLYGKGDPDQTIKIACRCGQDSDCNPSSSGGVLFTTTGFSQLPERFSSELDETRVFSHTAYNFPQLLDVCELLARQALEQAGGRVERDADGNEVFVIPPQEVRPSKLVSSWDPEPIANSRFTEAETAEIAEAAIPDGMREAVEKFAPGWQVADCGPDMNPGLREEFGGKTNVLVTHPLDDQAGCKLTRTVTLPEGKQSTLRLVVGHDPRGDWELIFRGNDEELLKQAISKDTCTDGWTEVRVDLSRFAGKEVKLELLNQPTGWAWEAGYWAAIELEAE